jgi:hypothetical protein
VNPRIMSSLLSLLASIMEQYFLAPTTYINIDINYSEVKSLDRRQIREVIAAEGLENLFQPDLLVNIYIYLGDLNACLRFAENMGDFKAVILLKGFWKLRNYNLTSVFGNISFLNVETFPSISAKEEVKELLEIGHLYNENIIDMAFEELTSSIEDLSISMNICINEECTTEWPFLQKTSYTCYKTLENSISIHCKDRLKIYQRYSWLMLFARAANMSKESINSKFPVISDRLRHVTSRIKIILSFEKEVRKLYVDEKLVAHRTEKILKLGLLLIKSTTHNRDVIGVCLQKAMQELSAKKLKEFTLHMQDFVKNSQLIVFQNNDPLNHFSLNLAHSLPSLAAANTAKDPDDIVLEKHWNAVNVLEENIKTFTGCKYNNFVTKNLDSDKKGLFRNIPFSATRRPDLIKYSKLWLEICSQVEYPIKSDMYWKFSLVQCQWYNKASNLPWRAPSHTISSMKLQPSTILKLFYKKKCDLMFSNHIEQEKILRSGNTLVNEKIQCGDPLSDSISQQDKHLLNGKFVSNQQSPKEEIRLSRDHYFLAEFDIENNKTSNSIVSENNQASGDEIEVNMITNNITKQNFEHESISDHDLSDQNSMIDNMEIQTTLQEHNYNPDIEPLQKSINLDNPESDVFSDLDTLNDHIPSIDTFFVPSLSFELDFTATHNLGSSMQSYEEKTSADFRFNKNIDFPKDLSSDARNVSEVISNLPSLLQFDNSAQSKSEAIQQIQLLIPGQTNFEQCKLLESAGLPTENEDCPVQLLSSAWKRENATPCDRRPANMKKDKIRERERKQDNMKLSKNTNFKKKDMKTAVAFGNFEISLQKFERGIKKRQNQYLRILKHEVCLTTPAKMYSNRNERSDNFLRCSNSTSAAVKSITEKAAPSKTCENTFTIAKSLHSNKTFIINMPNVNDLDRTFIISSLTPTENLEETFAFSFESEEMFNS